MQINGDQILMFKRIYQIHHKNTEFPGLLLVHEPAILHQISSILHPLDLQCLRMNSSRMSFIWVPVQAEKRGYQKSSSEPPNLEPSIPVVLPFRQPKK